VSNVEHVIVDGVFRKRDFTLLADVDRARTLVENARDYLVEAAAKAKAPAA
jgi:5-methylthioadenosine/S-adenosylhomocysteine deaminase